jgi:hypothetical protein
MTQQLRVIAIGPCLRDGNRGGKRTVVSLTFEAAGGKVTFTMLEPIAAHLLEKLESLDLPPSGMSPTKKLGN